MHAAYDTIQQDKLLQIVEGVLQEVRRPCGIIIPAVLMTARPDCVLDSALLASLAISGHLAQGIQARGVHRRSAFFCAPGPF